MAEIITGPFHMDEQGFLATIEELIERFDGYSSGKYLAELGKIHDEYGEIGSLSLFDEKVCELGKELFCSTSWVANLAWAMISFDYDLVEHDANFLDGCRNIVRKYGMSVWLYEMINDASIAVALQRPSSRMPFQIGLTYTKDVFRRSKKKGGKYATSKKKRLACMAEYLQEVYWLAAYSLLRWGEEEPRAADVALMVLGYGGIGMCMLRDDRKWWIPDAMKTSPIEICATICAILEFKPIWIMLAMPTLPNPCCLNIPRVWMRDICTMRGKSWKRIVLCGTSRLNQLRKSWNAFTRRARIR